MGAYKRPGIQVGMPRSTYDKWKPFPDFNPLNLSCLSRKDVIRTRIVPTVLLRSGYSFSVNNHGDASMEGPGIRPTQLCFGVYNLWFLMQWVEWSTGEPFDRMDDFSILSKPGLGVTVGHGHQDELRPHTVYLPRRIGDYWSYSDSSLNHADGDKMITISFRSVAQFCHISRLELPTTPGIWKRKMGSDTLDERRAWREALEKSGFCYYQHPTKAELYFSNAFNVAHGYPPTADLLGYPKLEVEFIPQLVYVPDNKHDQGCFDQLGDADPLEKPSSTSEEGLISRDVDSSESEHEECGGQ